MESKKQCTYCNKWKLDPSDFGHYTTRYGNKLTHGKCKECRQEATRAWRYNMTVEEMREFLNKYKDCPICDTDLSTTRSVIDHCHRTGKVRGVLCDECNKALGQIEKRGIDNFKIYLDDNT